MTADGNDGPGFWAKDPALSNGSLCSFMPSGALNSVRSMGADVLEPATEPLQKSTSASHEGSMEDHKSAKSLLQGCIRPMGLSKEVGRFAYACAYEDGGFVCVQVNISSRVREVLTHLIAWATPIRGGALKTTETAVNASAVLFH